MITALAAETLLVSVLAWMSIQASVTLASILTVILLPWALVRVRRSPGFAWMTLAMPAMLWRGEAWETVFLQSERQVSELQRQLQQPSESSAISFDQGQQILYDAVRLVGQGDLIQSLVLRVAESGELPWDPQKNISTYLNSNYQLQAGPTPTILYDIYCLMLLKAAAGL